MGESEEKFIHSYTLGRKNDFSWKIDDYCNIYIKTASGDVKKHPRKVKENELKQLDFFMKEKGWVELSSGSSHMHAQGMDEFFINKLKWTKTDAQLSGYLGTIFYNAGVWDYRKKEGMIQCRRIADNWCKLVRQYFEKSQG